MRAIEEGGDSKYLVPRLNELVEQDDELKARLALADRPDVVELLPSAMPLRWVISRPPYLPVTPPD